MADGELDIVDHISDLLAEKNTRAVKSIMIDEKYEPVICKRADDLIPIAAFYIDDRIIAKSPEVFRRSEKLIELCAEKGNPKECLLELLAQIESMVDVKFYVLLKPIQRTLLRIPERKAPLMQCVFNVIHSYIKQLKSPHLDCLIDNKSALLLDSDQDYRKIIDVYKIITDFYKPFVEEVMIEQESDRIKDIKNVLLYALIHLLDQPIMVLDLEYNDNKSSAVRVSCSNIVNMILKIQPDPLKFLILVDNKDTIAYEFQTSDTNQCDSDSQHSRFSQLSLAIFFYLIFGEKMCTSFPYVYNKLFIFQNAITLATLFLQNQNPLVLRKGLIFLKVILQRTDPDSCPFPYLNSDDHKKVIKYLSDIAVYHDIEENRKIAVDMIKQHFFVFQPKGQFHILLNLGNIEQHPNISGFLTTILTAVVRNVFSHVQLQEYFTGKRLFDLLKTYCSLKIGVETDLIENKDQILSALNLLTFLTVRDKENITGIWNYISNLSNSFLDPLREAIDMSRAHYELQLKTLDDPLKPSDGLEMDVSVGGQELDRMSTEEKKKVMNSGLVVFDLIEHLLCRLTECISDNKSHFINHDGL